MTALTIALLLLLTLLSGARGQSSEAIVSRRDRFGYPPVLAPLIARYRGLAPIAPPLWENSDSPWTWAPGKPEEGLNTTLDRLPRNLSTVQLPHRVLHPDTPFWYRSVLKLSGPAVLEIRADDGAQLWVNGKRIPAENGAFFPVEPAPDGVAKLTLRVLNKAMYGGLSRVRYVSAAAYTLWIQRTAARERLDSLVYRLRADETPEPEEVDAVLAAVREAEREAEKEVAGTDSAPPGAALLAAEEILARRPQIRLGPYLQNAAPDQVTVVWETDFPAKPTLEWTEGAEGGQRGAGGEPKFRQATITSEANGTLHLARLTGLKPGHSYRYRITGNPSVYHFRALPATGPFSFTVWADSQNSWSVFRQNITAMQATAPAAAFTVGVGDLVEDAWSVRPWREFLRTLTPLACEVPAMLVGGNHDYDGCFEDLHSPYFERYCRATPRSQHFAWSAGNARFIALDPNIFYPTAIPEGSAQYRWLREQLESPEWQRAEWRFLFIHQPPLAQGWAEYHGDPAIRALLEPLIEKYGIDFIVSGHAHDYERLTKTYGKQTCHFIIVGGAGGGLEDPPLSEWPKMDIVIRRHHFGKFQVHGRKVLFEAIATDTRTLDRLEASKPPVTP